MKNVAEIRIDFWGKLAARVERGSKTQAIVSQRQREPQTGDICNCFGSSGSGTRRSVGRWRVVKVQAISIYERGDGTYGVVVDGLELSIREKRALALREGFRGKEGNPWSAFEVMVLSGWIRRRGKGLLNFDGHVIHWDFNQPI